MLLIVAASGRQSNMVFDLAIGLCQSLALAQVLGPTIRLQTALIEERRAEEVTHLAGIPVAPSGISVRNPAFDVTPHHLISGIVTEAGVATDPYVQTLQDLAAARTKR